ncbi:MAG: nucleoside-diphosphate sugar epimerase/dehydratase [Moritella sp.]|uniref:polysaccharide biosynthesis protein n=1 Tax=Moritella sp. TaxID=78556 RepID=UPI0029B6EAE4|nr:nucleoside-diphosphate sugar epimerase/dehydratase [Moritella sp.]MDX2322621.1 nucleoside-diphosphate sugar epimerase/dehydratase [Moritella sp.]
MISLQYLFSLNRSQKRIVSVAIDILFILVAFWSALFVRLDSADVLLNNQYWVLVTLVCPISILAFIKLGLYRAILRYMGSKSLSAVVIGIAISAVSMVVFAYFFTINIPRTVPVIYAAFSLILIGGSRVLLRSLVGTGLKRIGEPVIIYGAGVSGRQLFTSLMQSHEYYPCAFVDDDKSLYGSSIQGVHVYAPSILAKLVEQKEVKKVLLALPSASRSRRQEVLRTLEPLALQVMTIPGMADLVSGDKLYSDIKEVEIEDLLGREAVSPRDDLMSANIKDKVVMVTGAGGSIGSELCRQIIKQAPKKLILFELSEFGLYAIERELSLSAQAQGLKVEILPMLGSVQRENRVQAIMQTFKVQTVYHAAAYKHVPMVEHNVVEGVRNNIFGTLYTARAAVAAKVETFVLISTDKAVRPTNVMGTTKRMAELSLQALAKEEHETRFCMVRFGNVLGSSGSVVPLFKKQIASGGPVTVTHPDITRYFMTIPEASQLVIQAGAMGKGGDVFVLDMGKSVKIVDLASKMIHLSGFTVKNETNPEGDISIEFSGLRPGEKLYEELLIGDNVTGTDHERIMTAHEVDLPWRSLHELLDNLDNACHHFEHEKIRALLLNAPTGFAPSDGICDLLWLEKNKDQRMNAEEGNIIPLVN